MDGVVVGLLHSGFDVHVRADPNGRIVVVHLVAGERKDSLGEVSVKVGIG